jgi:AAA ATPase domain
MGRPADVFAGVTAGICRLPANGRTATWAASTLTQVSAIRGREAEIAVLGDALERAQSGRRAVVLIEGEAGIGKTRLLDVALEDARRRGIQVAAGRAEELEGMRPFGLMTGVFGCTRSSPDPRRAAIAELLSGTAGERNPITVTSDPGLRFRVVDALADLVEELALAGPGCTYRTGRCRPTSPMSSPSSTSPRAPSWPPRRPGGEAR